MCCEVQCRVSLCAKVKSVLTALCAKGDSSMDLLFSSCLSRVIQETDGPRVEALEEPPASRAEGAVQWLFPPLCRELLGGWDLSGSVRS